MGTSPPPLVAFDTNIIIGLGAGEDVCLDCVETLKKAKLRPRLIITDTVAQELVAINGDPKKNASLRKCARAGLTGLHQRGFEFVRLQPAQHGIAAVVGDALRNHGLIDHAERNDSLIIAEAALVDCAYLVSSDKHVVDIDQAEMNRLLKAQHVGELKIVRPAIIVRQLGRR